MPAPDPSLAAYPICARCREPSAAHPNGACPDGQSSFVFTVNPAAIEFVKKNAGNPPAELAHKWIDKIQKEQG